MEPVPLEYEASSAFHLKLEEELAQTNLRLDRLKSKLKERCSPPTNNHISSVLIYSTMLLQRILYIDSCYHRELDHISHPKDWIAQTHNGSTLIVRAVADYHKKRLDRAQYSVDDIDAAKKWAIEALRQHGQQCLQSIDHLIEQNPLSELQILVGFVEIKAGLRHSARCVFAILRVLFEADRFIEQLTYEAVIAEAKLREDYSSDGEYYFTTREKMEASLKRELVGWLGDVHMMRNNIEQDIHTRVMEALNSLWPNE